MTAATANESVGPVPAQIGRYRLLCELGKGSMATLYLARAVGLRGLDRLFAIKMIHAHLAKDQAFVDMFLNEARIAARILHPNVVPVFEVDAAGDRHFIAMEYISGETLGCTLRAVSAANQQLPITLAAYIAGSACDGLHAAHSLKTRDGMSLNVIHRDVAAQNIMLGYDGVVRLMDFGLAKALDSVGGTNPGIVKGTIAYMSPEQVRGADLDCRTDIFSMGVVLWESLVGKRLFREPSDIRTAARILKMPIPPPSTLRDEVPKRLDATVMTALDRNPDNRFQTAQEMSKALHDCGLSPIGSGRQPDHKVLETYLRSVFSERLSQRREMENLARAPVPPRNLRRPTSKPRSDPFNAAVGAPDGDSDENKPSNQETTANVAPTGPLQSEATEKAKRPRVSIERKIETVVVREDRAPTVAGQSPPRAKPHEDKGPLAVGSEAPTTILRGFPQETPQETRSSASLRGAEVHLSDEGAETTAHEAVPLIDMTDAFFDNAEEPPPYVERAFIQRPVVLISLAAALVGAALILVVDGRGPASLSPTIKSSGEGAAFATVESHKRAFNSAQPESRAQPAISTPPAIAIPVQPDDRAQAENPAQPEDRAQAEDRAQESSAQPNGRARAESPAGSSDVAAREGATPDGSSASKAGPAMSETDAVKADAPSTASGVSSATHVTIAFEAKPRTATIFVDGERTDGDALVVPRSDRTYEVLFTAPQHSPVTRRITASASKTIRVALEPEQPARRKSRRRRDDTERRADTTSSRPPKAKHSPKSTKAPRGPVLLFDGKDL
ncbi:MAG: protein kinase [Deltaproteobacteria bacterium]|nr:protein kinase [Deltaproteobacteria bacterium]